jgi:hypothetical protein
MLRIAPTSVGFFFVELGMEGRLPAALYCSK